MRRLWQTITHQGLGALPILKPRQSLLQDAQLAQPYLDLVSPAVDCSDGACR